VTASTAEINVLDGVTATAVELNYVDGATSPIQTQLDAKASIDAPTFTGVPAAPTAAIATNTTQIATTAMVQGAILGRARRTARIAFANAANEPTLTFTDFAPLDTLYIDMRDVKCTVTTSAFLRVRFSTDNGVTFTTTPLQKSVSRNWNSVALSGRITKAVFPNAASGQTSTLEFFTNGAFANTDIYRGIYPAVDSVVNVNSVQFSFSVGDILAGSTFLITSERNA